MQTSHRRPFGTGSVLRTRGSCCRPARARCRAYCRVRPDSRRQGRLRCRPRRPGAGAVNSSPIPEFARRSRTHPGRMRARPSPLVGQSAVRPAEQLVPPAPSRRGTDPVRTTGGEPDLPAARSGILDEPSRADRPTSWQSCRRRIRPGSPATCRTWVAIRRNRAVGRAVPEELRCRDGADRTIGISLDGPEIAWGSCPARRNLPSAI